MQRVKLLETSKKSPFEEFIGILSELHAKQATFSHEQLENDEKIYSIIGCQMEEYTKNGDDAIPAYTINARKKCYFETPTGAIYHVDIENKTLRPEDGYGDAESDRNITDTIKKAPGWEFRNYNKKAEIMS